MQTGFFQLQQEEEEEEEEKGEKEYDASSSGRSGERRSAKTGPFQAKIVPLASK